jgi:hypothetical protein
MFAEQLVDPPPSLADAIVHTSGRREADAIPVIRLAKATANPERVVGVHFFNPVRGDIARLLQLTLAPPL